jgi:hypothetical protein
VTHTIALRLEIAQVFFGRSKIKSHSLNDFNTFGFKAFKLGGVIGDQAHLFDTEITQDARTNRIVTIVNCETKFSVCVNGVTALVLQRICTDLVGDTDAASLVPA